MRKQMDLRRQRAQEQSAARQAVRAREKAAEQIAANVLTGSPLWDRFLEQVHELQLADRAELAEIEQELAVPVYFEPVELAQRHHRLSVLRARIGARDECTRLPGKITAEEKAAAEGASS